MPLGPGRQADEIREFGDNMEKARLSRRASREGDRLLAKDPRLVEATEGVREAFRMRILELSMEIHVRGSDNPEAAVRAELENIFAQDPAHLDVTDRGMRMIELGIALELSPRFRNDPDLRNAFHERLQEVAGEVVSGGKQGTPEEIVEAVRKEVLGEE